MSLMTRNKGGMVTCPHMPSLRKNEVNNSMLMAAS